jgi:uncharacterized membrane protein
MIAEEEPCMSADRKEVIDDERGTSRLEAFSDGVIAVAITLLILDVHVPDVKTGLLGTLGAQWPAYVGYVTSFLLIGIYWANHHNMFKYIKRTDHFLLLINMLFLMCIVSIPFVTSLLTKYVQNIAEKHNAAFIYSGILLLTGILFNLIWWYAASNRHLLREDLTAHTLRHLTRTYLTGIPIYLLSLLISLVSVEASIILYILVALFYSLPVAHLRFRKGNYTEQANKQSG